MIDDPNAKRIDQQIYHEKYYIKIHKKKMEQGLPNAVCMEVNESLSSSTNPLSNNSILQQELTGGGNVEPINKKDSRTL